MDNETTPDYAGFWIRVAASIIDTILLLLIVVPALVGIYGEEYWLSEMFIVGFWDFILNYILPAIAIVIFWTYKSATPGKMIFRAVIVDEKTGNKPSTKQFIIRYLGYYVSSIVLGLGFFWIAWDKKKQGWHDKMAGTVVIRRKN